MKYRVQRREFSHAYSNPYRSGLAWTPWRTVAKLASLDEAKAYVELAKQRGGIVEYRIFHGKEIVG